MTRRLAISDIHGEGKRLGKVLRLANYDPKQDKLHLLGDYMDRGADSRDTIYAVMDLVYFGAIALRGNHDEMAIRAPDDPLVMKNWLKLGGDKTLKDFRGPIPANVLNWLIRLPLYTEYDDCILVHAGLKPDVPLDKQDHGELLWIRKEFHEGYRGKRVIFGHSPTSWITGDSNFREVWHGPDKTGIDTGAAYGGPLTLLDIDSGETWTA